MASEVNIPDFAEAQIELLQKELDAELAESAAQTSTLPPIALQRAGAAILGLSISSTRTGLGGKTVLELEPDAATSSSDKLPEHGVRVGDVVRVQTMTSGSAKKKEKSEAELAGCNGVVSKLMEGRISVALDKDDADMPQGRLWIVKLANDITYKRMTTIMTTLKSLPSGQMTSLVWILFGHSKPHSLSGSEINDFSLTPINPSLDQSQLSAIKFALASQDIALIHGPPGTGKTTTLIETILQLSINQAKRVLVCAASNIAVDNIVERLAPHKVPIVRLGHPARVLPQVVEHSLDALTRSSDAGEIVRDIRKELDDKTAELLVPRKKGAKGPRIDRRAKWAEVRNLRRDYRERERKSVEQVVKGSQIVLATLHGAGGRDLRGDRFDVLVIDEASQALEAQCWVALLGTGASSSSITKLILAGDHLQLPPTVKSSNSSSSKNKPKPTKEKDGKMSLETTMFDRLLALHGDRIKRMLTTQYRMHEAIMTFPSKELYDGKLTCGPGVEARLLTDLPYPVTDTDDTREPLVFWDTQGGDFPELVSTPEEVSSSGSKSLRSLLADSKSNPSEALLVRRHVRNLVASGVKPADIAVITPYNAQLALIGGLLKEEVPGIEMGSVDGFQGREKEAVVVSLVRSGEGEVGFLAEERRLNVSMTRPKRHLCVIGDSASLAKGSGFLKRWMAYLEANADLRYPEIGELEAED